MISTYPEAMSFLLDRTNFERQSASSFRHAEFKLERMRRLLHELGHPHRIPVVHIAGTKGKGSVAAMVSAVLQRSGYRTGLFTSPHLEAYEERIQVDGSRIPPEQVVELAEFLRNVVERLTARESSYNPTFFELTTALAWLWFQKQQVDLVVLEVGLGGRLDSTNLCQPEVTAITSVGLDHTQQLGETITEIAEEKSGIFKPGVPVVSGCTRPEARRVVQSRAAALGCRLWEVGREIRYEPDASGSLMQRFHVTTPRAAYSSLPLPLIGAHQGANLATAIGVVDCLGERGWHAQADRLHDALSGIQIPARQELISVNPPLLLDTSHNADSTKALVATVQEPRFAGFEKVLIFGSSRDKDIRSQLQLLKPCFQQILLTRSSASERSASPAEIVELCGWEGQPGVSTCPTAPEAWEKARSLIGSNTLLVISGSFYLSGELRSLILAEQKNRQSPSRVTA